MSKRQEVSVTLLPDSNDSTAAQASSRARRPARARPAARTSTPSRSLAGVMPKDSDWRLRPPSTVLNWNDSASMKE